MFDLSKYKIGQEIPEIEGHVNLSGNNARHEYGEIVRRGYTPDTLPRLIGELPVQFTRVTRSFDISYNSLTSLKGSPQFCTDFFCNQNSLTSLEGAPKEVRGLLNCANNPLTSLRGCSDKIGDSFDCGKNPKLVSLEGVPQQFWGSLYANKTGIRNLKGLPVGLTRLEISHCLNLESLEGIPKRISDALWISNVIGGKVYREEEMKKFVRTMCDCPYINVHIESADYDQ